MMTEYDLALAQSVVNEVCERGLFDSEAAFIQSNGGWCVKSVHKKPIVHEYRMSYRDIAHDGDEKTKESLAAWFYAQGEDG